MGSIEETSLTETLTTPVKILVAGGSYAGLAAALNLLDLCNGKAARFTPDDVTSDAPIIPIQIKVVDERDGYYHLIGSPLALASADFAAKAWTKFADLPAMRAPGISWTHGSVTQVDCENKTATIVDSITGKKSEESYDYLVASTGLRRAWPVVPQSLTRETYLAEAGTHIESVKNAKEGVVVIGGGAVGIEMASELKVIEPTQSVTLIHSRDKLLSSEPLPDDFKDRSNLVLQESGVKVILGQRVTDQKPIESEDGSPLFELTLSDGSKLRTSHVIMAVSKSIPSTTYLPDSALDPEGYVKIGPSLNFSIDTPNARNHFAVGDIAAWSGIKRCGAAMHMGSYAATNIHQQLLQKYHGKEPKLKELAEIPPMIAIAVGKQAVLYGPQDGTTWGEDKLEMMFGDNLGFSICWNYLQLGVDGSAPKKL